MLVTILILISIKNSINSLYEFINVKIILISFNNKVITF